jgi:hypothetical protein
MGVSSRTTQAARREAKVEERVHGWKSELDRDEVEMVESIVSNVVINIAGFGNEN